MYEIWLTIPCARPDEGTETCAVWKARGYKVACLVDGDTPAPGNIDYLLRVPKYGGYGWSINLLCKTLFFADFCIGGGHDTLPDPSHDPQDIAGDFVQHFGGTFGCMQPTGDMWLNQCIRHFAGSPWLGRDFINRINGGRGPYDESYRHYYDDTHLKAVCLKHHCYWERPDLIQEHNHWTKRGIERPDHLLDKAPLEPINRKRFEQFKAAGFPGSDPLNGF